MPTFTLSQQPQFEVKTIDSDVPISLEQINNVINGAEGVTLCIRSANGHPQRGGFFFCVSAPVNNEYSLYSMERQFIANFTGVRLVQFINHVTGLAFDMDMLFYCQNSINFRNDE